MDKVNEILSRETWNETDINTLFANQGLLPESAKVRLGLVPTPAIKAVEVPVKLPEVSEKVTESGLIGKFEVTSDPLPKKRGRKSVK